MRNSDPQEVEDDDESNATFLDTNTKYVSQVRNRPNEIVKKYIVNHIDTQIKDRNFHLRAEEIITISEMSYDNLLEKISKLGKLYIIHDIIICLNTEYMFEITIDFRIQYTTLYIIIYSSTIENLKKADKTFRDKFKDMSKDVISCEIKWYYTNAGGSVIYELLSEVLDDMIVEESYPFISNLDKFIQDYIDSDEKILILVGPPGTGKTRMIRYLLKQVGLQSLYKHRRLNTEVFYTVDNRVLKSDIMFMEFISTTARVMVLEDIDFSLRDRKKGNTEMYRLLSASDGLLQCANKKIIISTNDIITDIDAALVRPGRCFDIIKFRNLSKDEGNIFLKKMGSNHRVTEPHSLAKLYKIYKTGENKNESNLSKSQKRSIGLI